MKKKGFTLIELLAVIVVLAIIGLIAVPVVLNIIDTVRKNAAKESARSYIRGVETYTVSSMMSNNKMKLNSNKKYKVAQEDKIGDILLNDIIEIKGAKPYGSEDYLKLDKKYTVSEGKLTFNDYIITIEEGNITNVSTCDKVAVSDMVLNYDNQTMEKGSTFQITAGVVPNDATDTRVTYKSKDEEIASVDEKGIVTAVKQGTTKIIVTSVDNPDVKKECEVEVIVSAKGLKLVNENEEEITSAEIDQGKSVQINGLLEPNDVTTNALKWKSSDPRIAYVDENGLVYGAGVGEAKVTAETVNGIKKEVTIKVNKVIIDIEQITIENATIDVGNTLKLGVIMTAELDTEAIITWTSSNSEIASIDENGLLTAKKVGEVTITAQSGGKKATSTIKIKNATDDVAHMTIANATIHVGATLQLGTYGVNNKGEVVTTGTWSSSNTNVATVSSSGLVTAKSAGTTNIKVVVNGKTVTSTITVKNAVAAMTKMTITSAKMRVDDTLQLGAIATTTSGSTSTSATWTSSNTNVATVTSGGLVTAKGAGSVTITATVNGIKATSSITIESSLPLLASMVKVGEYVAYDAGVWSSTAAKPTSQGEFGGYTSGQNKANTVSWCLNSSETSVYKGWRVLKIASNKVYLVHAGIPECYYNMVNSSIAGSASASETAMGNRAKNQYLNSTYGESAHMMTWQEVFGVDSNANSSSNTKNDLLYLGPKGTTTNSANYWLQASNNNQLAFFRHEGHLWVMLDGDGGSFGVRPVIVLKAGVRTNGRTTDAVGQDAWSLVAP